MDPARLQGVYKECMKNHAATLGTYASDGCCEYIPDLDVRHGAHPSQLLCGACGCHRNFHRRDNPANSRSVGGGWQYRHGNSNYWDLPDVIDDAPEYQRGRHATGRRRQRTKFSSSQKARMASFAARIGWKIPKAGAGGDDSDDEVTRFCREIGVTRQVFKVWMHNHKSSCAHLVMASSISDTAVNLPDEAAPAVTVAASCTGLEDPMEVQ